MTCSLAEPILGVQRQISLLLGYRLDFYGEEVQHFI
jgi:hypothetical protein